MSKNLVVFLLVSVGRMDKNFEFRVRVRNGKCLSTNKWNVYAWTILGFIFSIHGCNYRGDLSTHDGNGELVCLE